MTGKFTSAFITVLLLGYGARGDVVNDTCENATWIYGQGIFEFDTTNATTDDEVGWYEDCTNDLSGSREIPNDVWFCWQPTVDSDYVTVDTCGLTTVDTKIAIYGVYEGHLCDCTEIYDESCDDDGCLTQSHVTFQNRSWYDSYLIRIGTADDPLVGGGTGTFAVTYGGDPDEPWQTFCDPSPEFCQSPGNWNAFATNRYDYYVADNFTPAVDGEISEICWWGTYWNDFGDFGGLLWDTFEVRYYENEDGLPGDLRAGPFSQLLFELDVEGPNLTTDSLIEEHREYEYRATHEPVPVSAGECLWLEITNSSYYGSDWHWESSTYGDGRATQDGRIDAVPDGYDMSDALAEDLAFCFDVPLMTDAECYIPPENDDCANSRPLTPGLTPFDTTGATTDGPLVPLLMPPWDAPCGFPLGDDRIHGDIWFDFAAPCSGILTVSLCDSRFDTKLAVYAGEECSILDTPLACDDDACGDDPNVLSALSLSVDDRVGYKIRIGGYAEATGPGMIDLDFVVMPPETTDLYDYAKFTACLTGSCVGSRCMPPLYTDRCCKAQDFDGDGDVDLRDYEGLLAVWGDPQHRRPGDTGGTHPDELRVVSPTGTASMVHH